MPNTHLTLSSLFSDIADAIRAKTGSSAQIIADNFPTAIANIPSGEIDPSDATATASDILYPETAYISTGKVTGTMPDNGSVDVTLDTTNTSYTVAGGKHSGSGTVKVVPQTKSATPTTSAQTISADSGKVLSSVSVSAIQTQTKSATPSTSAQTITPDSGKYLTSVSVGAIPNQRSGKQGDITPSSSAQTSYIPSGWHDGSTYFNVGASSGVTKPSKTVIKSGTSSGLVNFSSTVTGLLLFYISGGITGIQNGISGFDVENIINYCIQLDTEGKYYLYNQTNSSKPYYRIGGNGTYYMWKFDNLNEVVNCLGL